MKNEARRVIVSAISKIKDTLSLKRAVRFFFISTKTFFNWKNALKHKCEDSIFNNCVKRWPNQLTKKEVNIIKQMLTDKKYKGWSIASIC